MTYTFRVTLKGLKGFYRVYRINSSNTLYSFHKQMRADMEFPQDQLILFKAYDENGAVVARYGLFDLGAGAADKVTIAQTIKNGIVAFTYFYDVESRKSVEIALEGECKDNADIPTLVDVKGPNPIEFENGYIAFEDLPDEQRHLPGEKKKNPLEELLNIDLDKDLDGDDDDLEGDDDEAEDEEEDEGNDFGSDMPEIYDGTEELSL